MKLEISVIPVSPFMQNCRIVYNPVTKKALVMDPGDHSERIVAEVEHLDLEVVAIFLTHGHLDHASAVDDVRETFKVPVYMHSQETPVYNFIGPSRSMYGLELKQPSPVDHYIKEGEEYDHLGTPMRVIFTPGHTPGGCCFYFYDVDEPFVIVGDTLFEGSVGRTDLPGGNQGQLVDSIKNKLYKLADETIVMSGHGDDTTIGQEKRHNPFVRG